jgi:AcrR family transcriptional regulator
MLVIVNLLGVTKRVNQAVDLDSPPKDRSAGGEGSGRRGGGLRRKAIFAAALRLFRERGFHGTAINDIGAAAGVTGPALYRHFSGKDEVLAEAIRDGTKRIADATRGALSATDLSPAQALESLVRSYVGVALENADVYAAYVLELRHLPDELRVPIWRAERRHRGEWKRVLLAVRPDLDPEEAATLVTMAVFSVVSLCMVPSRIAPDALVDLATGRVMAMLLATAPNPEADAEAEGEAGEEG